MHAVIACLSRYISHLARDIYMHSSRTARLRSLNSTEGKKDTNKSSIMADLLLEPAAISNGNAGNLVTSKFVEAVWLAARPKESAADHIQEVNRTTLSQFGRRPNADDFNTFYPVFVAGLAHLNNYIDAIRQTSYNDVFVPLVEGKTL